MSLSEIEHAPAASKPDAESDTSPISLQRLYDSLHQQYTIVPTIDPIVSPRGITTTDDFVDPPGYSHRPWAASNCPNPGEFSAYYGVYTPFLPFEYHDDDRLETAQLIMEHLNNRPPTCERTAQAVLRGQNMLADDNHALPVEEVCLLAGWWPGDWKRSSGVHFMSPEYCHGHDATYCYTETVERIVIAHKAAAVGLTLDDLALLFGMGYRQSAGKFLERRGIQWGRLKHEGRIRLARTVKTIRSWGHEWQSIAAAFGRPVSTVQMWVADWASEFEPPPDPNVEGFERPIVDWALERRNRSSRYDDVGTVDYPLFRRPSLDLSLNELIISSTIRSSYTNADVGVRGHYLPASVRKNAQSTGATP